MCVLGSTCCSLACLLALQCGWDMLRNTVLPEYGKRTKKRKMCNSSLCLGQKAWSLQLVGCCRELPWRAFTCRNNSNSIAGDGLGFGTGHCTQWALSWEPLDCGCGANIADEHTTHSQTAEPVKLPFILNVPHFAHRQCDTF